MKSGTRRKPAVRRKRKPANSKTTRRSKRSQELPSRLGSVELQEIESLRAELDRLAARTPPRWNANADDVRRSVARLVLTLVEFIRQLLERQAIRRMEAHTLTDDEIEAIGLALMRLEDTVRELAAQFGLSPEDLNLDVGPVGKLM